MKSSSEHHLSVASGASVGAVLLVALNLPRLDRGAVEEARLGPAPEEQRKHGEIKVTRGHGPLAFGVKSSEPHFENDWKSK